MSLVTPHPPYLKPLGASVALFGVVAIVLGFVVGNGFHCGAILLVLCGLSLRHGDHGAALWAMVLQAFDVVSAVAVVVQFLVNGPLEAGWVGAAASLPLGAWGGVNLVFLAEARSRRAADQAALKQSEAPEKALPPLRFRFSLRSLFVALVIVALGCAAGSRRLPPSMQRSITQSFSSAGGSGLLAAGVIQYRDGTPVAGYLWRAEGEALREVRERFAISTQRSKGRSECELQIDDLKVTPSKEFQLFVNDLDGNPRRLIVPRDQADQLFRGNLDMDKLGEFWNTWVEPQRKRMSADKDDTDSWDELTDSWDELEMEP